MGASREAALDAASFILNHPRAKLLRHPDYHHQKIESLGIKDSHDLKNKSFAKPLLGNKKVFIVELFFLTPEASNALLKLFEEPPEGTYFFLITRSADTVAPTLRSRLAVIEFDRESREDVFCLDFLSAAPGKRMRMIKKLEKDKNDAMEFLNGLEKIIESGARQDNQKLSSQERLSALEGITSARGFLMIRSSNVKMILEHLALTLPKMLQ